MSGSSASGLVEDLLRRQPRRFGAVLERAAAHRLQILYTQIDRDAANHPRFTSHAFRVDAGEYFYPASTVKLAGAVLALEKLRRLGIDGLTADTPVRIGSAGPGQTAVDADETSPTGLPTIGHYLHKLFVVSDNDAYNRLYEFVGQAALNEELRRRGYTDVRLTHRLSVPLSAAGNARTNPMTFYDACSGRTLYEQPALCSDASYAAATPIPLGLAHVVDGARVESPLDFAAKNAMSLQTLQDLLKAVVFPRAVPPARRFDLTPDDYDRLYRSMSMLPRESVHPRFDDYDHWYDGYVKFFLYGAGKQRIPDHVRLFNKVGLAYGFLCDNAYVVDFDAGVEFLLTATIYVNADGVLDDGNYEYDAVGFPFLADLGRAIYEHELARPRPRRPDLRRFAPYRGGR